MESLTQLSKKMSFALRHKPEQFNLTLDSEGWVELETFANHLGTTVPIVQQVVAQDAKQRFTVQTGRIRASQGHTISVSIKFATPEPPSVLWHGTTETAIPAIMETGLLPMQRQYVHLSASPEQAEIVGSRRKGKLIILKIDAEKLSQHAPLMVAENGVWLTKFVPVSCLTVSE